MRTQIIRKSNVQCDSPYLYIKSFVCTKTFLIKHVKHFALSWKKNCMRKNKEAFSLESRPYLRREVERPFNMATTEFQVYVCVRDFEISLCSLSVVGAVTLSTFVISHLSSSSSLTSCLFEKTLVEEMRVTGESLILQTKEQVPEIHTSDALPCRSGAGRTSPTRKRRARS